MSQNTEYKIAFLDQAEFVGGAEHFLLDFFETLSPTDIRRLRPIIIGAEAKNYKKRLPQNIPIQNFDYPGVKGGKINKILAVIKLLLAAIKLKKTLKQHKIKTVFTNTPRTHFIMWFVHSLGWKGQWITMFHDFTTRPEILIKSIGRKANTVIANSVPTRNWLRKNFDEKDHSKIRIVENGVNFQKITATNETQQVLKVLNIGRIDPRKGQIYFAEAADLLLERNPDLKFTILGDSVKTNPDTIKYEKEIQDFIDKRKLNNLVLKPSVENPLETINQFDAVVFTPTEPETFGRVVIEALSLGKLVIAFDQTGPREIIRQYLKEFSALSNEEIPLVEVNNAMSLAESIGFFADNPESVKKLTQKAQSFVKKHFDLEITKKHLMDILLTD